MAVRLSALRAGHIFTPRKILSTHFEPRIIERLEGLDQFKNQMTSSGIEPATFVMLKMNMKIGSSHSDDYEDFYLPGI
jgi:hypothetical protein